ncbi:MAG: CBS domain-containing protein [Infirmifilum sp.]
MNTSEHKEEFLIPLVSLRDTTTVNVAAEKMWENEVPVVPVVDAEKKYIGVVSIFTLLKTRVQGSTKLRSLIEKAPLVELPADPIYVARLLARTGLPGLAVLKGGDVAGIVSARRVIYALKLAPRVPARHLMYPLEPLEPDDSIEKARKIIAQVGLRLLPVAKDGKLLGVVKVYDLVNFIYNTPLRRDRLGEVKGEVEYFLDQPVSKIITSSHRIVNVDTLPIVEDIAEGAVIVDSKQMVVGVISPYIFLRRLLSQLEEARLPVTVEGVDELDFVEQNLITRKVLETARIVAERANLLELSVVIKSREKTGDRRWYEVKVSIKLDKGVYSTSSAGWSAFEAVSEALELAYKNFSKTKEKKRERRIDLARLRKSLGF